MDHNKLWKIPKEMRVPESTRPLYLSPENLYSGQEVTELHMEQWTGSKLGKEYDKAIYCHPACLTSM